MHTLVPWSCRLYEVRIDGAPTAEPGLLGLPRKAGLPPGTDAGLLGASRL